MSASPERKTRNRLLEAKRIRKRLGPTAATALDKPPTAQFVETFGRVDLHEMVGIGKNNRLLVHLRTANRAGQRADLVLFGSLDNLDGCGPLDHFEDGWYSSAWYAIKQLLDSRGRQNTTQWDDEESRSVEALKIALHDGCNSGRQPERPEMRGRSIAHAKACELMAEVYTDVVLTPGRWNFRNDPDFEGTERIIVGRPLWIRTTTDEAVVRYAELREGPRWARWWWAIKAGRAVARTARRLPFVPSPASVPYSPPEVETIETARLPHRPGHPRAGAEQGIRGRELMPRVGPLASMDTMLRMTTAVYADQFLRRALALTRGDLQHDIHPADYLVREAQFDEDAERAVVSYLCGRGLVRATTTRADGHHILVRLTEAGAQEARRLQAAAESRSARDTYLHDTVPRWIYENTPAGGHADLSNFARSEQWWFCGSEVTWDEVDASIRYLQQHGLVENTVRLNAGVRLTARGIDFALTAPGTSLRSFMDDEKTTIRTGDITVGAGAALGIGRDISQTVTTEVTATTGIKAADLLEVVQIVRANSALLGLAAEQEQELLQHVDVLEQQAQGEPDQALVRTVGGRILEWISSPAAGPARQMVYAFVAEKLGLPMPTPAAS